MSIDGRLEAFERNQKERFGAWLLEQVRVGRIQFVGEEKRHGEETVTERVCNQERCRHANIEMTPEERGARSIPPGYNEEDRFTQAEKDKWNQEREMHMVNQLHAENGKADRILVICGRLHAGPIRNQLEKLGHSVERCDLQDQDWYIEDWQSHMLQL